MSEWVERFFEEKVNGYSLKTIENIVNVQGQLLFMKATALMV
jgi:hypothetical protein